MEALKYVLDFQWAAGLSDGAVRGLFLAFFALTAVFVLAQRRDYVYQGAPDQAWWRDLRLWAMGILLVQSAIYLSF
jgi:hypothetical protein